MEVIGIGINRKWTWLEVYCFVSVISNNKLKENYDPQLPLDDIFYGKKERFISTTYCLSVTVLTVF